MIRFSRTLVAAQIALSCTLLIVSGLLIKSVVTVSRITIPFRTDLLYARITWPQRPYTDAAAYRQATERTLAALLSEPGVSGAAVATGLPDDAPAETLAFDGVASQGSTRTRARRLVVSTEFFTVTGIRPLSGRLFDDGDRDGRPRVAIVTADLARRYFPASDPIGQRIRIGTDAAAPFSTIVGVLPTIVVANTTSQSTPPDTVLLPYAQAPTRTITLLVSATGDASQALAATRRAVARVDADIPLSNVTTVAQRYHDQSWPIRLFGTLFASFGLAALLLATAGLYGLMAFGVRSRTHELGIRVAVGARPVAIVAMVLREGTVLMAAGLAIGLGLGAALARQFRLFFFGVTAWEPGIFLTVAAVLAAAGLAATFIPARRAATIDPMTALRDQ